MRLLGEPDLREQVLRVAVGRVAVARGEVDGEAHVLLGGQRWDQVEELEDEADVLATEQRELLAVHAPDLLAVEHDRAAGRGVDAADEVQQRGLARARGAQNGDELAAT